MPQQRKQKETKFKLKQPDRSGPDPSVETLLEIAQKRGLAKAQRDRQAELDAEGEEILIGRLGDSILWTISLTMLHLTLDVLVTHQYAVDLVWRDIVWRTAQAFPGMLYYTLWFSQCELTISVIWLLVYALHPHQEPSKILPRLPNRIHSIVHSLFFFTVSICAGCYLIYATNEHGYFAVMKQAPPIGCLWVWSVIELHILWAVPSALICVAYLKLNGFAFL
jgi:hypothetical protein